MLRETKLADHFRPAGLHPLSYFALIVLLAYSGPFGTQALGSFPFRLLFWGGIVLGAVLTGRACQFGVSRKFGHRKPLIQDGLIVLIMTVWLSPFLYGFVWLMSRDALMLSFLGTAQYVSVVTAGLCVVRRSLPGTGLSWYVPRERAEAKTEPRPEPVRPRLARRLPDDFGYPVLRLSADNHLVEVIGEGKSHAVRLRFSDAVNEMDPIDGFCTHRSHWVSRAAVVGMERENGQLRVRLSNGDLVPVSRKYRHNVDALEET